MVLYLVNIVLEYSTLYITNQFIIYSILIKLLIIHRDNYNNLSMQ